jgi:hypothetical protein
MPAFRDAFRKRRCIIRANGLYEWKKTYPTKQPCAIVPEGDPLFAFAGLWENWRCRAAGEGAEWIETCTIITGRPNELVAPIHDPHAGDPAPRGVGAVAGGESARADRLQALLKPYPTEAHACLFRSAPRSTA